MGARMGARWTRWRAAALATLLLAACGENPTGPDPALGLLVGEWNAKSLVLTSVANPQVHPDLIALGAAFKLDVQPSGQYTAILVYAQQASTEIGTITVSGNTMTLNRDFPTRSTSAAVFRISGNTLTMDGDTEFDFNLDGTPEDALAHFELERR